MAGAFSILGYKYKHLLSFSNFAIKRNEFFQFVEFVLVFLFLICDNSEMSFLPKEGTWLSRLIEWMVCLKFCTCGSLTAAPCKYFEVPRPKFVVVYVVLAFFNCISYFSHFNLLMRRWVVGLICFLKIITIDVQLLFCFGLVLIPKNLLLWLKTFCKLFSE